VGWGPIQQWWVSWDSEELKLRAPPLTAVISVLLSERRTVFFTCNLRFTMRSLQSTVQFSGGIVF